MKLTVDGVVGVLLKLHVGGVVEVIQLLGGLILYTFIKADTVISENLKKEMTLENAVV